MSLFGLHVSHTVTVSHVFFFLRGQEAPSGHVDWKVYYVLLHAIYVSSYYYKCVRILLHVSAYYEYHMCPRTTICVRIIYYVCARILLYVSSCYYKCDCYICVLMILYMCPHTTIYVCA